MGKNGLVRKFAVLALFFAGAAGLSWAQESGLPKNIDVYVPAKAGGGTDVMARAVANQISKLTGSNLVILNNIDGNGVVALETIRNAKPDGKQIMQFHTSMIIQTAMGKYKYNVLNDFHDHRRRTKPCRDRLCASRSS